MLVRTRWSRRAGGEVEGVDSVFDFNSQWAGFGTERDGCGKGVEELLDDETGGQSGVATEIDFRLGSEPANVVAVGSSDELDRFG